MGRINLRISSKTAARNTRSRRSGGQGTLAVSQFWIGCLPAAGPHQPGPQAQAQRRDPPSLGKQTGKPWRHQGRRKMSKDGLARHSLLTANLLSRMPYRRTHWLALTCGPLTPPLRDVWRIVCCKESSVAKNLVLFPYSSPESTIHQHPQPPHPRRSSLNTP